MCALCCARVCVVLFAVPQKIRLILLSHKKIYLVSRKKHPLFCVCLYMYHASQHTHTHKHNSGNTDQPGILQKIYFVTQPQWIRRWHVSSININGISFWKSVGVLTCLRNYSVSRNARAQHPQVEFRMRACFVGNKSAFHSARRERNTTRPLRHHCERCCALVLQNKVVY